jgi:Lon protease-like protein
MTTHTHTQTISLFPLGSTLFPEGVMLLKIFEVRYLDMVKQCVREGSGFGVVTLNGGNEVRTPGQAVSFNPVGTFARIKEFDPVQPSLFMIQCYGERRFRVKSSQTQKNGLVTAEVEFLEEDVKTEIPEELKPASEVLGRVIQSFKEQGAALGKELPFSKPYRFNECGWVANRWCELLQLSPGQKQFFLEQENPRLRLDLVHELLEEMGVYKAVK